MGAGDVLARAYVRWLEIQRSLAFVRDQLETLPSGAARVPLLVRCPGTVPAGVTSPVLVNHVDLGPTLCEAIDQDAYACNGRSAWNALCGQGETHREWLYAPVGAQQMVREPGWQGLPRLWGQRACGGG